MIINQFQAHPWHGIPSGDKAPETVNAFIEIIPSDTVKYEIDKASGHMKIDRPQKYSNLCPMPYGFIPRTLCNGKVGKIAAEKMGQKEIVGDQDPIDICVLTERPINHGGILVTARPIGGFRMIDGDEADDKIIAVLDQDSVYGEAKDIKDVSQQLIDRLRHYFLTYKQIPGEEQKELVSIPHIYGAKEAQMIIKAAMDDYDEATRV